MKASERFWEIDTLRGVAILMMITYHILFDVNFFHLYSLDLLSLPVLLFLYPIGTLFLLLVGMSLTLSYSRAVDVLSARQIQKKFLIRGVFILGCGMLVTFVTWLYLGEGFVVFGVLHCIGVSILLAYPFIQQRTVSLVLGVLCVGVGLVLYTMVTVDFPWLLWLGFIPVHFYTVDYFPLLPWFGVVLIGIGLGNRLYQKNTRLFHIRDLSQVLVVRGLCFLGRHSLVIYLIHQPIIVGLLLFLS